ncbi:hypothetical protein KKF91_08675 [Myxococcota bacterium]|nr:hypothetical protein [Myxococcota bacterium]
MTDRDKNALALGASAHAQLARIERNLLDDIFGEARPTPLTHAVEAGLRRVPGQRRLPPRLAFSHDDRALLASAGLGAGLFDVGSGAAFRLFEGHASHVTQARLCPKDAQLISTDLEGVTRVFDARQGGALASLSTAPVRFDDVALTREGRALGVATSGDTIHLVDVLEARPLATLRRHVGHARLARLSPDGALIASGGVDHLVLLWDTATGALLGALEGHRDWIVDLRFTAQGRGLLSTGLDGVMRLWDVATHQPIAAFEGRPAELDVVDASADLSTLLVGDDDGQLTLLNVQSGAALLRVQGAKHPIRAVAFAHHGLRFASVSDALRVNLWDEGVMVREIAPWGRQDVGLPAGLSLAQQNDLRALLSTPRPTTLERHAREAEAVALSPDGLTEATAQGDNDVHLIDAHTRAPLLDFKGHSGGTICVAFSPDGARLASGAADKRVHLWDSLTGARIVALEGHSDAVHTVDFRPDGGVLASGGADRAVRLWDVRFGAPLATLQGHTQALDRVRFSPDGRGLVSQAGAELIVWDALMGLSRLRVAFPLAPRAWITALALSSGGEHLSAGASTGEIVTWDVNTGEKLSAVAAPGVVEALRFYADGRLMALVSGAVRFLDVQAGRVLGLWALSDGAWALEAGPFYKDGHVAVCEQGEAEQRWPLPPDDARRASYSNGNRDWSAVHDELFGAGFVMPAPLDPSVALELLKATPMALGFEAE